MFKKAHEQKLLKYANYIVLQMVQEPSFLATDRRFKPIMDRCEGIGYECHQLNHHWPLQTSWGKPEKNQQRCKVDAGHYSRFYGQNVGMPPSVYRKRLESRLPSEGPPRQKNRHLRRSNPYRAPRGKVSIRYLRISMRTCTTEPGPSRRP